VPRSSEAVRALREAAGQPGAPGGSDTLLFLALGIVLVAAGAGAGLLIRRRNPAT
jgi:LPXTG-motif cell wall-anchored protein